MECLAGVALAELAFGRESDLKPPGPRDPAQPHLKAPRWHRCWAKSELSLSRPSCSTLHGRPPPSKVTPTRKQTTATTDHDNSSAHQLTSTTATTTRTHQRRPQSPHRRRAQQ